jgi:hypothetical protein
MDVDSLEMLHTGTPEIKNEPMDVKKEFLPPHELKLGLTGIYQVSPAGKEQINHGGKISAASGSVDIEMSFFPLKTSRTFLHLESGKGSGLDAIAESFSGFNFDADDNPELRVTELWYEQDLLEGRLRSQLGKIDLSTTFDRNIAANSETLQFLSPGFRNNPALEFPVRNSPGLSLWLSTGELFDLGFAIAEADADWNRIFDDLFSILEIDLKPQFNQMQGNYRLYFWKNNLQHQLLLKEGNSQKGNYGFGISADQELSRSLIVFSRIGIQRGDLSRMHYAFSAGLQFSSDNTETEENVFGAAYGINFIGRYGRMLDSMSFITSAHEHHIELYYNFRLNSFIRISPDIQWIKNLEANARAGSLWAFGLRTQFSI